MKKQFLRLIPITAFFFLIACNNTSTSKKDVGEDKEKDATEIKTVETKPIDNASKTTISVSPQDSSVESKTTISVSPEGSSVKTKSTDVQVNKKGVSVGTKDVKVDIKTIK